MQDATASTEIHRAIFLLMLWSLARLVRDGARPQRPSPPGGQSLRKEGGVEVHQGAPVPRRL
jgi:hypothetical protein